MRKAESPKPAIFGDLFHDVYKYASLRQLLPAHDAMSRSGSKKEKPMTR